MNAGKWLAIHTANLLLHARRSATDSSTLTPAWVVTVRRYRAPVIHETLGCEGKKNGRRETTIFPGYVRQRTETLVTIEDSRQSGALRQQPGTVRRETPAAMNPSNSDPVRDRMTRKIK